MESADHFILLFLLALPAGFGWWIFRKQNSHIQILKAELKHKSEALKSSGLALIEHEMTRLAHSSIFPEAGHSNQIDPSQQNIFPVFESSESIALLSDAAGQIIRMNPFARQCIGYSEKDNPSLNFRDFLSLRQQILFISRYNNAIESGKSVPFSIDYKNRFDEQMHLEILLLPSAEGREVFIFGLVISRFPGFGPGRFASVLESLIFRGKWPALLLEKSGKPGELRKLRVLWISASAGRLFGLDPVKSHGLLLESISSGLAAHVMKRRVLGDATPLWKLSRDSEDAFRILQYQDGDYAYLQLIRRDEMADAAFASQLLQPAVSGELTLSFSRLLEITEGDPGFLQELLPSYLSALRDCRSQFRRCMDESSLEKLRFLHHKIKATIRTFGLAALEVIFLEAIELVQSGKSIDPAANARLMADLNTVCTDAESEILEFARQNGLSF